MLSPQSADSGEAHYRVEVMPARRRLSPSMRRALRIRVHALRQEQRAASLEFESLYDRGDELLAEIVERQQRLRLFREILLANGGAHE